MSVKANPTWIGLFVLGAVGLGVVAIVLFGGGRFFKDTETYVLFFSGSVSGLQIGAPVEFRGVRVGRVTDVFAVWDPTLETLHIPVYIELGSGRVTTVAGDAEVGPGAGEEGEEEDVVLRLVRSGMRAQLQMRSMVTGQLFVSLDMQPDTPIELRGIEARAPELPTIPSGMEEFQDTVSGALATLRKLPVDEIAEDIREAVNAIKKIVSAPEAQRVLPQLNKALEGTERVVGQLETLVEDVGATVDPMEYRLANTLDEVAAAARALRVLAEFLERHPEALVRGKPGGGGE